MQPMVFKDGPVKEGPIKVQPALPLLSGSEKYRQLKKQTEDAGMTVREKNRKIVVSRKKK